MHIDWSSDFDAMLDRLEASAGAGDDEVRGNELMTDRRTPEGFVHGNPRLAGLLEDPERRARVDEIRAEMDADDRAYRMNLATVRQAGHLTQVELAKRLGVSQGVVSRTEARGDMLYSTLLSYLHAAGVEDVSIVATVGGRRVEIDLEGASVPEPTKG